MKRLRLVPLAFALALVGCEGESFVLGASPIGLKLSLEPGADTIFVGDSLTPNDYIRLRAVVTSTQTAGAPVNVRVFWQSTNPSVARVDTLGFVYAVNFGTASIIANANGKADTAQVAVVHRTSTLVMTPTAVAINVDDPLVVGDTTRLRAIARDRSGNVASGTRISWSTSASQIAVVDQGGLVRAVSRGTVTITATGAGLSVTSSVTVRPLVKAVTVSSPVAQALALDTLRLSASAINLADQALAGRRFTWASSNTSVAVVDSAGRAQVLSPGTARITATTGFVSGFVDVDVQPRVLTLMDVGDDFSCGVANLGRGYCWGEQAEGRLGVAADSSCAGGLVPVREPCTISPRRFAPGITFTSISAGATSACGIGQDQFVYCWGADSLGQLGDGNRGTLVSDLVRRATVSTIRFKAVSVGGTHACAISTQDRLYCWGNDLNGQLGDERNVMSSTPIPLSLNFENVTWSRVSAGSSHTCAITTTGAAYCWGLNNAGQLGDGTTTDRNTPTLVGGGLSFSEIAAGGRHTCAVATGGNAHCWGSNDAGQSGQAVTGPVPYLLPVTVGLTGISSLTAGDAHNCAIGAAGVASCWGLNSWGQLGNGSTTGGSASPVVITGLAFRQVSAGARHTCGMTTAGAAYCWGSNVYGALGNELQAAPRGTPQLVARPR